jgi:hypothetical protein
MTKENKTTDQEDNQPKDKTYGWELITPRSVMVYTKHGTRNISGESALIKKLLKEKYPNGVPHFPEMPSLWVRILPWTGSYKMGAQTREVHLKRQTKTDRKHSPKDPFSNFERRKVYIDHVAAAWETPHYNFYNLGGFGFSIYEDEMKRLDSSVLPAISLRGSDAKKIGEVIGFNTMAEIVSKPVRQDGESLFEINGKTYRISSISMLEMAIGWFSAELERRTESGLLEEAMDWMNDFENALALEDGDENGVK